MDFAFARRVLILIVYNARRPVARSPVAELQRAPSGERPAGPRNVARAGADRAFSVWSRTPPLRHGNRTHLDSAAAVRSDASGKHAASRTIVAGGRSGALPATFRPTKSRVPRAGPWRGSKGQSPLVGLQGQSPWPLLPSPDCPDAATTQSRIAVSGQGTERGVDGMDALLSARGRGQAPKPRSGASKTPGLRSAPGRKTMGSAVPLPCPVCFITLHARPGIGIDIATRRHRRRTWRRGLDRLEFLRRQVSQRRMQVVAGCRPPR